MGVYKTLLFGRIKRSISGIGFQGYKTTNMVSVRKEKATIEGKKERDALRQKLLRFVAKCVLGDSMQTLLLLVVINSGRSENAKVMVTSLRNKLLKIFWTTYPGAYYNCTKNEYLRQKYLYEAEVNSYLKTATNSQLIDQLWGYYSMKLSHTLRYLDRISYGKELYKHPQMGIVNIGGPQRREWWLVFPAKVATTRPGVIWHDPDLNGNLYQFCIAAVGADIQYYRPFQDAELTYVWDKPLKVAKLEDTLYVEVTDLIPEEVGGGFRLAWDTGYEPGEYIVGFILGLGTGYMDYFGRSPHFSIPEEGVNVPTTGLERYVEASWGTGVSETERKEYSGGLFWLGSRYPSYGEYGGTSFAYADRTYLAQKLAQWPDYTRGDGITMLKRVPSAAEATSIKNNLEVWMEPSTFVPSVLEKD